ncbi:hypothetical protein LEP1GSC202_2547 [Leptospira yanagawae serovar Saopaulo str. Sao Paulo = ATCC 700523]|uniref:Uncharacterized protein n=1 Tax=Leptospira yanagawae serovar Saopaulo str. Sao Paulo = ATCC 700523 TaxID=1249483 RepID=A0A5E8H8Z2_9LEPT|nr:hypothetical protein LEP1GSC202_2547 [Leptospira yanagawae serovar Saopaulo str. Sao Paulo = ATCC 700523]
MLNIEISKSKREVKNKGQNVTHYHRIPMGFGSYQSLI